MNIFDNQHVDQTSPAWNELIGQSKSNLRLFTPTIVSSGGGVPTYSTQIGRVVTSGNLKFIKIHVVLATLGTLAAGNITIEGNPFTSEATTGNGTPLTVAGTALAAGATTSLQAIIQPNASIITPYTYAAGNITQLTVALLTGTSNLFFEGFFET